MSKEQTHPLHATDKIIIDSLITKKEPKDLDLINLARLINRYTNFPGEFEIKEISLTSVQGDVLDLMSQVNLVSINIFEDMFKTKKIMSEVYKTGNIRTAVRWFMRQ